MNKLTTMGAIVLMLISIFAVSVSAADPVFDMVSDLTMDEGTSSDVLLSAIDADGDALTYSIVSAPSWVTISGATLTLAPGFTVVGSSSATFTVDVEVSDGVGTDTESFTATVNHIVPTSTLLVVSDVTLGSDRQVRSNPEADDEVDQNVYTTGSFTVTNNGPDPLTGIEVTSAVLIGSASDFDITITSDALTSLDAGASATVSFSARVPEDLDAVDADARKVAPLVARFTVSGTLAGTTLSVTNDVTMEAENQLDIKKLKVCVNGDCETVDDGDKVDGLKPGDSIEITFKLKNRFRDNDAEDLEMEDVEVFVVVEDSDFDVEEDDMVGDINANDEEEVTLSFEIEDDADDGTVSMSAWVEAEDENGAKHGELFEIRLEVERERHEVSLRSVRLDPDTLSCNVGGDQTVVLTLELQNTGRDDEDDVTVEIENTELGITKVERNIEIDENDRDRKTYTLRVPSDAESGVYALSVKVFTRRDDISDSDDMLLTVPACAAPELVVLDPVVEEEDEEIIVVTGPAPDATTPAPAPADATATPVASSSGTSSTSSGMYVALLVAIIIVLVIIGVMLVNALAKRN